MYYSGRYISPIGPAMLASDGTHLVGLWLEGQKYYASTVKEELHPQDDLPVLEAARGWLDRYFAGKRPEIAELPLAPAGSSFRQEVWGILCEIPYGKVITYGAIAEKIAEKRSRQSMSPQSMSPQAAGNAVGHNPISIIIPCHRVIGSDGSLTGYAGGIEKKRRLLELEGADCC